MTHPLLQRSRFGPKPRPEIQTRNEDIRRRFAQGESMTAISRAYDLPRQSVENVVHVERFLCRQRVRDAIESGDLVRPDRCERCRQVAFVEAHHADYNRPLDVEWVCRTCHRAEHHGDLPARNERIASLHAGGLGYRRIAKTLGISRTRVRQILIHLKKEQQS